MRLILAIVLTATQICPGPARADDALDTTAAARPGAVALYIQAAELYALGQTAKDPLTVLTAARLLRGLTLTDTARSPDPAPAATTPLTPLDPQTLLDTARSLDAGQSYTDLIAQVTTEAQVRPQALRGTVARLAPGATQTWTLPFFGGTYAELAILGDGAGNLDLLVTADNGSQICLDKGNADTAFCGFALRDNGSVTVTVNNTGTTPDTYTLLTN